MRVKHSLLLLLLISCFSNLGLCSSQLRIRINHGRIFSSCTFYVHIHVYSRRWWIKHCTCVVLLLPWYCEIQTTLYTPRGCTPLNCGHSECRCRPPSQSPDCACALLLQKRAKKFTWARLWGADTLCLVSQSALSSLDWRPLRMPHAPNLTWPELFWWQQLYIFLQPRTSLHLIQHYILFFIMN